MKLPNVILAGAQKAGTTSFYYWLGQHHDIYAEKSMKDYNFFANNDLLSFGLEWFSKSFTGASHESIILHGHVGYLYLANIAAKNIYTYNNNIKIIIILRNPVERAYSAYWEAKKTAREDSLKFEDALAKEPNRLKGTIEGKSTLAYVDHGFYSKQLKIFYQYFPQKQIKVILFDELKDNPKKVVHETCNFLQIENDFRPNFTIKNIAGVPRSVWLQKKLIKLTITNSIKKILPAKITANTKIYLIRNLNIKKIRYPPINADTKHYLIDKYKYEIETLEYMIGKNLSKWRE